MSDTAASRRLTGIARLLRATRVSLKALAWALREEEAFRLEVLALLVVIPLALWLGDTCVERAVVRRVAASADRGIAQYRAGSSGGPHRSGAS